jgi:predicted PurR-regulated permease PerM/catechol 2,3-dioxygenase-like lactoylglutathione lyase family enzyme
LASRIAAVAFLARDYDEAIAWFRDVLGFAVIEDRSMGDDKRWVVVGTPAFDGARFVVAKASDPNQIAAVGQPAGGRVAYFLETDDFVRDHARLIAAGVEFLEIPRREAYGEVAVFRDPWGGKWDLIEPADAATPMPFKRQLALWAGLGVVAALAFNTFGSQLAPFGAGIAVGYLLNPVARRMERLGFSRLMASLTILLAFVGVVGLAGVTLAPALAKQVALFSSKLPGYVETLQKLIAERGALFMTQHGGPWLEQFGLGETFTSDQIQKSIGDLMSQSGAWALAGLKRLAVGGAALLGVLSFLIVTPVVAFYILVDWDAMIETVDSWLPRDYRGELRQIAGQIDYALAGFVRGQLSVCVFLGLWYGIGLSLIGLDFALLIGTAGGVLSIVPYIGSLTALVFGLSVAIVQKWPDFHLLLMTLAVIGSGQFLEGYVVSPKLVGESIGLHPVWLIFALFAFGALFGFTGLLVAVPTSAALGVIVRHLIASYQRSPWYRGRRAAQAA